MTVVAVCEFSLIFLTFVLLVFHFSRAIQLVNALSIVKRFHRRGVKQLKKMKRLEEDLIKAGIIRPAQNAN
jgi:hypothetical protein